MWMQLRWVRWTGLKTSQCASLTLHHWKRPSNLSSLPKATAGPGAHQTSPAADAVPWPAGSSPSTHTSWISTSTVSCGWISAGASTRSWEELEKWAVPCPWWQEWWQPSKAQHNPAHSQQSAAEGRSGQGKKRKKGKWQQIKHSFWGNCF